MICGIGMMIIIKIFNKVLYKNHVMQDLQLLYIRVIHNTYMGLINHFCYLNSKSWKKCYIHVYLHVCVLNECFYLCKGPLREALK